MIFGDQRGPIDEDAVADHYPWPDRGGRPYVRSMMVSTLDGAAAGSDGLSGSVSGDADRAVFAAVRRYADAVLVGSGTLREEGYGPMRADEDDAPAREANGQAPAPRLATLSGSLDLPLDEDSFAGSDLKPLVFTGSGAEQDRIDALEERYEVVVADTEKPEASWVVDQLVERGLWRIVCEGGPSLLRDVAAAGLLDEVDLTLSPMMVGTDETPRTSMLEDAASYRLVHVLTEDGFLMTRSVRDDDAGEQSA